MQIVCFQQSAVLKTKFVYMNEELPANEINQSMRDNELVGSRAENIIRADWNYVPKSVGTMKTLALALLTLLCSSDSHEALFSHMNFMKSSTGNRLQADMSAACFKLKTADYKPQIIPLADKMHPHVSH